MKLRAIATILLLASGATSVVASAAAADTGTLEGATGGPTSVAGAASDGAASQAAMPNYVPDVAGQFAALARRPDGLGFNLGQSPDPWMCKHYQGMARVQGADGTNYMLVSRSGNAHWSCPGEDDDDGNLLIVEMGSRERSGERLRSNRFARDWYMAQDDPAYPSTPPDARDVVVRTISFDGVAWPSFGHPGGMQVVGDVLALALEGSYDGAPDQIMFMDVSDPLHPTRLSSFRLPDQGSEDFGAGLVGITPVRTSSGGCCGYLMVVTGKENKDVRFYRSLPTATDGSSELASPALQWEEVGRYTEGEIERCLGADWHTGGGDAHQMLNFVRSGLDDQLWLIGGRNTTGAPSGDDMIDLYRVGVGIDGTPDDCILRHVRSTHVTSYPVMGGGDSANFAAASGVYVSPSGELIVYAAEFENDGPPTLNPDGTTGRQTVRFAEYRHRDVVRPDSPTVRPGVTIDGGDTVWVDEGGTTSVTGQGTAPATRAWIQLFEDDGGGRHLPPWHGNDEWLIVDHPDRDADDFDDLEKVSRIDENAGSWRWFAPIGCTIHADQLSVGEPGAPGGDARRLFGSGQVQEEIDLDRIDYDDEVGAIRFGANCDRYYDAPVGVEWDRDGDGEFELRDAIAPVDASRLDGPSTAQLTARGLHPTDPGPLRFGAPVTVEVQVRNVAPTITSMAVRDRLGNGVGSEVPVLLAGQPATLDVTFTDPGYHDTQTATVSWGDGTVDTSFDRFSDARHGAVGRLVHDHVYREPGRYRARVTVRDDDGGTTTHDIWVDVVSAADGIRAVIDRIDAAIAAADDPAVIAALIQAREQLDGNLDGQAANGALDALESDDAATAITKLAAAIDQLAAAAEAGASDVGPLQDLLGSVARMLAQAALDDATVAVQPASRGEQRQLDAIAASIAEGDDLLEAGQHTASCDRFRQAVEKAVRLLP